MRKLKLLLALCPIMAWAQVKPSEAQLEWQSMEMNMFCHFGPNTFTGNEWGNGQEAESVFNPTELDCRQWAATARKAGFKGIIITAKHHDGFCLWPSSQSTHTVRESPCGKDILKELSEACSEEGLKFGVYVSPWDRNAPTYGSSEYNQVFMKTLEEVHTQYGDVFEQWFDGACGEGPNGKRQVYDWDAFNRQVLSIHPNAIIFSDLGPGCRWMGNESGVCGRTCWSTMNLEDAEGNRYQPGTGVPSQSILNTGEADGKYWVPAETDVSIRPGWFWRKSEHPKSLQQLLSIYYTSVGRNSLLLLNVPPDTRGLIDAEDSVRLMEFRAALDTIFAHDIVLEAQHLKLRLKMKSDPRHPSENLIFNKPVQFNRIVLQENIQNGQNISQFKVMVKRAGNDDWITIAEETTMGYKRILLVPQQRHVKQISVQVTDSRGECSIKRLSLYQDDIFDASQLLEEHVHRTTDGLK